MTLTPTEAGNVVDMGNGDRMNTGIAQPTSVPVDATLQPNAPAPQVQTPTQATAPTVLPPGQPGQPGQTGQTATPATPTPAPPQHPVAGMFNKILTMAVGGPTSYVDANGNRILAPQSNMTLGKVLTSALLAGIFAKDSYTDTPFGPRRDFAGTGANAVAASQGVLQAARARPQQISDEQAQIQTRKLKTLQANAELVKTMSASALQAHATLQSQIDSNKPLLNDIDEATKTLQTGEEPIALAPHMSKDDAMAALKQKGYTNWTAIPDGTVSVFNPQTGQNEDHPTYRVVNPSAQIKLSPEAANIAALTNPAFTNLHDTVGGDVKVPMSIAIAANQEVMAVHIAQKEADDLVAAGLGTKTNLMAAVKNNRQLLPAIDAARDQVAAGLAPWRVLDAIRSSKNGSVLLDAMGIDTQKAADYIQTSHNKEVAAAKLAESGGLGDKALMPNAADELRKNGQALGLTPAQVDNAVGKVPPQGMTVGEYRQASDRVQAQANANTTSQQQKGTPADIDILSDQLLKPNNLMAMRDVGGRGTQKEAILAEAARKAKAQGIPFDIGLVNHRIKFLDEYENPTGRAAINRQAINNVLQHAGDLSDLNQMNRRGDVRILNTPLNKLKGQFGDQTYTQYQTASGVLKDELALYFAGGYAPSADQQEMWNKIQSDTATPGQTEAFAKEVVRLAARRANTFNQQFRTNMGYDDMNMITPQAKAAAERLGMGNEVAQFGSGGQLGTQPRPIQPVAHVVPAGAIAGRDAAGNIIGYRTPDGKVVKF